MFSEEGGTPVHFKRLGGVMRQPWDWGHRARGFPSLCTAHPELPPPPSRLRPAQGQVSGRWWLVARAKQGCRGCAQGVEGMEGVRPQVGVQPVRALREQVRWRGFLGPGFPSRSI